ncbi:hypothetical protein A0H81_05818 [Grifola frondosa]|uniref:Chromo domain-containing protein n=1 Tax=Grifola frondosa TaxID=5627 RepID=A0A1C7MB09_GRIFR|nr:hypothetical protein A0H81_05818 [Grifola frondosa]
MLKFVSDQLIWLLQCNVKMTWPFDKLDHRCLGPFPIAHIISDSTYQLHLPAYLSCLHPIFHVSLLEPYSDPSKFHLHAPPEPFDLDDSPELTVASILDCRKLSQHYEYFVHWKGLSESEDSWVLLSDIPTTANELLEHFHC